jgi:hypothetical protein
MSHLLHLKGQVEELIRIQMECSGKKGWPTFSSY